MASECPVQCSQQQNTGPEECSPGSHIVVLNSTFSYYSSFSQKLLFLLLIISVKLFYAFLNLPDSWYKCFRIVLDVGEEKL